MLNIPYRHEATYPVTLDELMDLLENLIGTIANPRSRRGGLKFEPVEVPDFKDYFVSLENIIGKYEDLIIRKIGDKGFGMLQSIIADLDTTDSIRCFFAILFLARDAKVDLEQEGDDIKITLVAGK
jgi:segregation and condensation protein A